MPDPENPTCKSGLVDRRRLSPVQVDDGDDNDSSDQSKLKALSLVQLKFGFYFLGLGLSVAGVVLLGEVAGHKLSRMYKKRMKMVA